MAPLSQPREKESAELFRDRLIAAWERTDEIFAIVSPAETLAQPIVWRHPFIFYIGHLPAFAWNQVCGASLAWRSRNPYFDDLYCRGVDPDVDTGECHWHPEVSEKWPDLSATLAYRDEVREAVLRAVEVLSDRVAKKVMARVSRVLYMVLEHEYMHQEMLLYMMQQMPLECKRPPAQRGPYAFQSAPASKPVLIPGGKARMGAKFEAVAFGWDNEFDETVAEVPSFEIDTLPVTNGEFLEFVEAGGYDDERHWRPEDWRWKELERKRHPTCWGKREKEWFYRAMFDEFPLAQVSDWPVGVSLAEARAYATWRGRRLPSEAEYHRAAFYGPDGRETLYPWGNEPPASQHGNFGFRCWSPEPVGSTPAGASRWGVSELIGNGWELTDSSFAPFPGFIPYIESYPDYSRDFFDGKHYVVKGGSWATAVELLRPGFRNWYQAHYPYVFAKFRCVDG